MRFILQAVRDEDHIGTVKEMFNMPDFQSAAVSTAFMTSSGVSLIQEALAPVAQQTTLFVGVRNGITTAQALEHAIDLGCKTFIVDTGTHSRIFHPKFYFAQGLKNAKIIIGSANLTTGGLSANIEASIVQDIDLDANAEFLIDFEDKMHRLKYDHPQNVTEIKNIDQISALLSAGIVADESKNKRGSVVGSSKDRSPDHVPRMQLKVSTRAVTKHSSSLAPTAYQSSERGTDDELRLVWESKPLTERDLNIPTNPKTNPTGSMLFKKGAWSKINPQKYFRHEVFSKLDWVRDSNPQKAHIEHATSQFQLSIKGVNYGSFDLEISFNTRDTEKLRAARNSNTHLHWGKAKPLIAQRNLLQCTLRLFEDTSNTAKWVIEID